jgi:hypothetical protein
MNVKQEIVEIVKEAEALSNLPYDETYRQRDTALGERILALDKASQPGLNPGRQLRFQVADGYAYYIIIKVLKRVVHVVHIPWGDNWHFNGAYLDERNNICIPYQVADRVAYYEERMSELFAKKA